MRAAIQKKSVLDSDSPFSRGKEGVLQKEHLLNGGNWSEIRKQIGSRYSLEEVKEMRERLGNIHMEKSNELSSDPAGSLSARAANILVPHDESSAEGGQKFSFLIIRPPCTTMIATTFVMLVTIEYDNFSNKETRNQ